MERKFKDGFSDIFEELTWHFFGMSEGNPYIIDMNVKRHNLERQQAKDKQQGMNH